MIETPQRYCNSIARIISIVKALQTFLAVFFCSLFRLGLVNEDWNEWNAWRLEVKTSICIFMFLNKIYV